MAPSNKKHISLSSLRSGRPPTAAAPTRTLAARHTRRIIRAHHTLNKQLTKARADGDQAQIAAYEAAIAAQGGLAAYQAASIQGQSKTRGGDSSVELLRWLTSAREEEKEAEGAVSPLSLLEVGALSTTNACSRASTLFSPVTRIDLRAQGPGIQQQDFMLRPLPKSPAEQFDVLSLSLVLNFVPGTAQRGEMLWRTTLFLKDPPAVSPTAQPTTSPTPCLFLVLPAPCVTNSRYMTEAHLEVLMTGLGYVLRHRKVTAKLYYSLWQLQRRLLGRPSVGRKVKLNDGPARNNFCVEIKENCAAAVQMAGNNGNTGVAQAPAVNSQQATAKKRKK